MPISPWASFATWLHLEAFLENTKKINKYQLSNIELVFTHTVSKLGVLGIVGKLSVPSLTLCKKIATQRLPKTQLTIIGLIGILRINMSFIKLH